MFTLRTPGSRTKLGQQLPKEELAKLKEKYQAVDAMQINRFLQQLPRDMLFVTRAANMVGLLLRTKCALTGHGFRLAL